MKRFTEFYFNKEIDQLTWQDLLNFIDKRIEESQNLEYKPRGLLVDQGDKVIKPTKPNEVVGFSALAKQVSGFANAEGGLLILGVKEKEEKYKGQVIKRLPGDLSPLPPSVTREMLELNLYTKIQYHLEKISIKGVTNPANREQTIYIIDIPQSIIAPHRVDELYYYQRYNFDTLRMQHYQIADLFGRRLGPFLEVVLEETQAMNSHLGHFAIEPLIYNRGNTVAKYVTCIITIKNGPYKFGQVEHHWRKTNDQITCQYSMGTNSVVYPDIPSATGYINFQPENNNVQKGTPVLLSIALFAENMARRVFDITYSPK